MKRKRLDPTIIGNEFDTPRRRLNRFHSLRERSLQGLHYYRYLRSSSKKVRKSICKFKMA